MITCLVGCALVEDEEDDYGIVVCGVCGTLTPAQVKFCSFILKACRENESWFLTVNKINLQSDSRIKMQQ